MPDTQHRQLAAILFADIAGYTSLMQKDEEKALEKLAQFKAVLEHRAIEFHGSIIQYYGDGCLMIFQSSLDALLFAIAAQSDFRTEPALPVRIGIHSGDIIMKEGLVFGDAVNITSRIESMGTPGSILVSDTVWLQIKNKPEFELMPVGKFDFKNVEQPIEIFALGSHGMMVPKQEEMKGKIRPSDKDASLEPVIKRKYLLFIIPVFLLAVFLLWKNFFQPYGNYPSGEKSIAIMPLRNLSGDENQDYFAEGIVEAIYGKLAQVEKLRVTSMTSMLGYRDQRKTIGEIAKELRVKHILEGSVSRAGDEVQINVRLVDATNDRLLWTQSYNRKISDLFAVQKNIAQAVVSELEAKLSPEEKSRIAEIKVTDISAYDIYLSGLNDYRAYSITLDTMLNESALRKAFKAVTLDPQFDEGFSLLADTWYERRNYGFGEMMLDSANYYADKALKINSENDDALYRKASIAWNRADYTRSKQLAEEALQIAPNNTRALQLLANYYMHESEDVEKSISLLVKAIALDPKNPQGKGTSLYAQLGEIYLRADLLEEAEALFLKALEISSGRESRTAVTSLGYLYYVSGEFDKSIQYRKQQLDLTPDDFGAINEYAGANYAAGNLDEAEKYYRQLQHLIESGFKETYSSYIFRHRLAHILSIKGKKEEAGKLFNEHLKNEMADLEKGTRHFGQEYSIAGAYAAMGEKQKAYEWLEKMPFWYITYQFIRVDPLFKDLRDEERFKNIMALHHEKMQRLQSGIRTLEADGKLQVLLDLD